MIKLKLKDNMKEYGIVLLFYILIIVLVILVNKRFQSLNEIVKTEPIVCINN